MSGRHTRGGTAVGVIAAIVGTCIGLIPTAAGAAPMNSIRTIGGASLDDVTGVAWDGEGNVVVGGNFHGSATVKGGNQQTLNANAGGYDGYVAKYDEGGAIDWAYSLGGSDIDQVHGVTVDAAGDVYVVGNTQGTSFAYPGGSVPLAANTEGFIVKFTSAGAVAWVRLISGATHQHIYGVGTSYGMLYVVGDTSGPTTVSLPSPDGTVSNPSFGAAGMANGLVAGYTTAGVPLWLKVMGSATEWDSLRDVEATPDGAYVTGPFNGTATYGTIDLVESDGEESAVLSMTPSGSVTWATNAEKSSVDIAVAEDRVYVGASTLEAYERSDGSPVWSRVLPGVASVDIGPYGQPMVAGSFSGTKTVPMVTGPDQSLVSAGSSDLFVGALSSTDGQFFSVEREGGAGLDAARAIAVDAAGTAVVGGLYQDGADFSGVTLAAGGTGDGVVARYRMGPAFHGVTPARVLDTRDGTGGPKAKFGPGEMRQVKVTSVGGVPAGASAVVVNLTAVGATATSHLTVWPAGSDKPVASSLNFPAGRTTPNLAVVQVGTGGYISIANNSGSVDVLVDVTGWFDRDASGDRFSGVAPVRLLDTRKPGFTKLGAGSTLGLTVTSVGGVPANASAVVVNVTATDPSAESHLTVYPTGVSKPLASNLNFGAGQTVPNLVVVKVGTGGKISIFNNSGQVHVIVDVVGYYSPGVAPGQAIAVVPTRLLDTRNGLGGPAIAFLPGESRDLTIAWAGPVPQNAKGVVLNVTVTQPTSASHLTVWPSGQALPESSNLNFSGGQTVANLVMVKLGTNGKVTLRNNSGFVHVIADVVAWYG